MNPSFEGKVLQIWMGYLLHVMLDHPTVALSDYRSGGLYLSLEFLADNGFVVDFEEYFFTVGRWKHQLRMKILKL